VHCYSVQFDMNDRSIFYKFSCLWITALTNFDNRYGTGTLTSVFIERVFQECLTYDGEMDYKTYLDFVLALENRKESQSLQYMFRLLDVQNKGCLTIFDLNYFFRVRYCFVFYYYYRS